AGAIGLANCVYVRSEDVFRCEGHSQLNGVADVEVTIGAKSNKVTEIQYWIFRDSYYRGDYREKYGTLTKEDVINFLKMPVCAPKDTSHILNSNDRELCLGGNDRIRAIGPSNSTKTSRRNSSNGGQS